MERLFLIRHGTPEYDASYALSKNGIVEINSIGNKLENLCENPTIISSPVTRALESGKILSDILDATLLKREYFGCLQTVFSEERLIEFDNMINSIGKRYNSSEIIITAHSETLQNLVPYFLKNNFPKEFSNMRDSKNYIEEFGILREQIPCGTGYEIDCNTGICLKFT